MKIVVIVGGTSEPSNSELLADAFVEGIRRAEGASVEKILLRALAINHFTIACYDPAFKPEPDFRTVEALVRDADGLVFATPIWNFGVPGNLKNLIDRFGSFALDPERRTRGQWKDTPFYLVFTGGSPGAAWKGLLRRTTSGLPTSLQYFGGAHVGTHFEPRCTPGKGKFNLVVDGRPASLAAMRRKGGAFAHVVRDHVESGRLPLRIRLAREFYRFGQQIQRKFF
jgi:multimeric flavodoxin WrbA